MPRPTYRATHFDVVRLDDDGSVRLMIEGVYGLGGETFVCELPAGLAQGLTAELLTHSRPKRTEER